MAAQQEVAFARNQARIGGTERCIVDEVEAEGRAIGRTEGDAPEIDGTIRIYEKGRVFTAGEILKVTVTAAHGYDLEGTPA
jgi:ribosomal protein S12 methylthiotransferase